MVADKVLLAIDGSSHAEAAAAWYLEHMHRPGNEVILVHGMEMPSMPSRETWASQSKEGRGKGRALGEKFTNIFAKESIPTKVLMDFEKPGEYIVKMAQTEKATVIIMGTRGLGKIRRTILGSVSDYVIHHSSCPVLICRD